MVYSKRARHFKNRQEFGLLAKNRTELIQTTYLHMFQSRNHEGVIQVSELVGTERV